MKKVVYLVALALFQTNPTTVAADPPDFAATLECFSAAVESLAADDMEGRGIGTEGIERAADLIEAAFRDLGFDEAGVGFRLSFEVTTGVQLGEENHLELNGAALTVEQDFIPLGFSASGEFSGPLVFAGYGIRAEELGYDDYADIDAQGRVVLVFRYEPGEQDEQSPFDGRRATRWSDLRHKAVQAREAGAAALVFVAGQRDNGADDDEEPDRLPPLRLVGPSSHAGLPVLQVSRATAAQWLNSHGYDLWAIQTSIDESYHPQSFALPDIDVSGRVSLVQTQDTVHNVVAVLPGEGSLANEVVVVGAHYDHLGYGGQSSMRPDSREIHNGADDNASGVAGMLCGVARLQLPERWEQLNSEGERRTLLAVAFSAEEIGTAGSTYYVDNPLFPLENTVAMVNLDMVGRVVDGQLSVLGADSAPEWEAWLSPLAEPVGLTLEIGGDGYGPSDQMAFYSAGVPVTHLFSGTHSEYHTPEDDAGLINSDGGARVSILLESLLVRLLTDPTRPTYQRSTSGPTMIGDSRGYGSYLGTVPDMSSMMGAEGGVLLADVRDGGPAHTAGIRGGDTITQMASMVIQNLYDMSFALQDHRPGETIEIIVLRNSEELTFRAVLGRRGESPQQGLPTGHPMIPDDDWQPTAD